QGVMLDENSLAVSYDFVRGEPRGKLTRKKIQDAEASGVTLNQGDCIDCKLCVQVCPTGIDIRNGTQLECVNCTACIDACDEVMMKIDKPTQLIRIDSYNGIVHKKQSLFNTRVIAYSVVLAILIGLESFLMLSRSDVDTLILRTPGMTYQDNKDGYISNLYNYKLNNKTDDEYPVTFKVTNIDGALIEVVGEGAKTLKKQTSEGVLFIKIPKDKLKGQKTDLEISVLHDGQIVDETSSTFFGPIK
ncbi:MAG TPA: FixG Ig-like domain-containing protein, partial [Saprospiraceae bacterium]|nr:FixG Ig-like domain-containing protein [Saprospiraceae bacterium]